MFARSPYELAPAGALLALLAAACVSDVRTRRIPNALVATIAVVGVLVSTALDPVLPGMLRALAGLGVGLALWIPGWLLRVMGAGDVKLFAAAGAWLGPAGAVDASILAALAGGLLAIIFLVMRRGATGTRDTLWLAAAQPKSMLRERTTEPRRNLLPYSVAIAAGVAIELIFPRLVLG